MTALLNWLYLHHITSLDCENDSIYMTVLISFRLLFFNRRIALLTPGGTRGWERYPPCDKQQARDALTAGFRQYSLHIMAETYG